MKIFETHAHYDDERFDEDRDELISSMLSDTGELDYIVNVGASRQGCEASLALAAQYEKVYAAIGFHPEDIVRLKESDIEWLENMLGESKARKIVALGEIGLITTMCQMMQMLRRLKRSSSVNGLQHRWMLRTAHTCR